METDLTDLHDDAVLLTTELASNAIRHAGTVVDLRVISDGETLRVTVGDGAPGELPQVDVEAMARRAYASGGRGLALVDRIATEWGATHDQRGKVVWFELRRAGDRAGARRDDADPADLSGPGGAGPGAGVARDEPALADLPGAARPPDVEADGRDFRHAVDDLVAAALERLVSVAGCAGARVRVDRDDGAGAQEIAAVGAPNALLREVRAPVPMAPPWSGELSLLVARASSRRDRQICEIVAASIGLALDNDRLRRDDLRRRAALRHAAVASDLLAQSLDIKLTTALIPRLVVPWLGAWCAVMRHQDNGPLTLAAAAHADESRTAFLRAALGHPANLAAMADAVARRAGASLAAAVDGVAVPMMVRDQPLGVLAVGRPADHRHTPDELVALDDLARRAALALDNAALHAERQQVARTLQQSLLPPSLPDVPGMRFAAEYIPALGGADVGGDFYDVAPLPAGGHVMVIGDVSGKGVAAAAVTGIIRDVFRVLIRDERPCPEILRRLNETVKERGTGRFATLAVAEVAADGANLRARLYLAGHDHPLAARADGRVEPVGARGTAIGLLDQIRITPAEVSLEPGDTLVFYTDGVTERRRGDELFGPQRVRAALRGLGGHDAEIVAARLRAATIAFSPEPPRDDIAILAVHNDGSAHAT